MAVLRLLDLGGGLRPGPSRAARRAVDRRDRLRPWRITGPRVEAGFHPFHERVAGTGLGVVANETHQCFGRFTGRARADDGTWVDLDGLTGWAKEARNRW